MTGFAASVSKMPTYSHGCRVLLSIKTDMDDFIVKIKYRKKHPHTAQNPIYQYLLNVYYPPEVYPEQKIVYLISSYYYFILKNPNIQTITGQRICVKLYG
jgi:hypothetical protein